MASLGKPTECPHCERSDGLRKIITTWTNPDYEGWICDNCIQEVEAAIFPEAFIVYRPKRNKNKCRECGAKRGEVKFHKHGNICTECRKAYNIEYGIKNHDKLLEQKREYYAANRTQIRKRSDAYWQSGWTPFLSSLCHRTKKTATQNMSGKPRNLEFTLTREFIYKLAEEQDYKCALSGIKMEHKWSNMRSASIDRIDSSKGYIPNNIQLVCKSINLMKNTNTQEETIKFLQEIQNENM